MKRLGFVGLGIMGGGMAANLIGKGHDLVVWNRTPGRGDHLAARRATNLGDLASLSDIVFICVSDTADVEEVVFGHAGLMSTLAPGSILIDHSTISPGATRKMAQRADNQGIIWVDAPVSGGSEGARDGTLAVMMGGAPEAVETVRPYLEAYSSTITHVGPQPGAGQMAKLVNQILVVINQLAVSEALLLASKAGLDVGRVIDAVKGGAAGSWMLSNRGPQMMRRDWAPGFTIDLQQKDLRLVLEAADELGVPVPGTALVFQLYRSLQAAGLGSEGNHALVKALEKMSGTEM